MYLMLRMIGIFLSLISVVLAMLKIHHWYFIGVIGFWLLFASSPKRKTSLGLLLHDRKKFLFLYFVFFLLGCTIELVGRFILHWWSYPYIHSTTMEILLLAFYPFILLSFREMHDILEITTKSRSLALVSSMIIGITIWELPNLVTMDWIYSIPILTSMQIYNFNIILIAGWAILIGAPTYLYSKMDK